MSLARYAELFRRDQITALTAAMARYDVDFDEFSPTVLMLRGMKDQPR